MPTRSIDAYGQGWAGCVYSYVKNRRYACPDDPTNSAVYPTANENLRFQYRSRAFSRMLRDGAAVRDKGKQIWRRQTQLKLTADRATAAKTALAVAIPQPTATLLLTQTGQIGGHTYLTTIANGTVHNDGSNYLAEDGHVKFLRPIVISGGRGASAPNSQEVYTNGASGTTFAAGTGNMTLASGGTVQLTFSPI